MGIHCLTHARTFLWFVLQWIQDQRNDQIEKMAKWNCLGSVKDEEFCGERFDEATLCIASEGLNLKKRKRQNSNIWKEFEMKCNC